MNDDRWHSTIFATVGALQVVAATHSTNDAGGATYRVVAVEDSTDALTVKAVHGPYEAE